VKLALAVAGIQFALVAASVGSASGNAPAPPKAGGRAARSSAAQSQAATRAAILPMPAPPPPALAMLPRVARVRVEAARDHVVLVEEVNLARGDWQDGGLDLYVAFGAPGTPIAVEARLVPVASGVLEARLDDPGEVVPVEAAVRRAPGTTPLLGRPQMAGVIVHAKDSALRRALSASDVAALRIRSLLRAPSAGADGARTLVVRLGIASGLPMALGRVQVVSMEREPWITRAVSTLCGPDADPWPLSTALLPRAAGRKTDEPPSIAPEMAVRHATDDLCIRWWGKF
jgi:hypothetical protein